MARTITLAKDVFSGIRESAYCGCMVGGLCLIKPQYFRKCDTASVVCACFKEC
jgi:hypothetical protein